MLYPSITVTFSFLKELEHILYTCLNVYYISLDTYGKYFLNMSVFIMYETMYYMYVYTVRTNCVPISFCIIMKI